MVTDAGLGNVRLSDARAVAAGTPDPELPQLTLGDLGILRDVGVAAGRVVVTITPTYSGCPAMREIAADLRARLQRAGYPESEVRTVLSPAWTTDWITEQGRAKLAAAGIAPPGPAAPRPGPIALTLAPPKSVRCPHCGSPQTAETSRFGSTACKSLHRCLRCDEPFEAVKPL